MYRISVPEEEQENDADDENGGELDSQVGSDALPEIKMIWMSEILDKDKLLFRRKSKHMWFKEQFHSAISIQDRNDKERFKGIKKEQVFFQIQEYFFFFDRYHMYMFYKLKRENQQSSFVVLEDQNIMGLFFSDNNYMYTLSNKRPALNISSGFRLFDIWNCISTGSALSYELSRVQVGCQALIDFSQRNQRFVFQSSFDRLEVLPVLHRNSIFFMGMGERESYLATRVIDDRFVALDNKNHITTWSTLSGKVVNEVDLGKSVKENVGTNYANFKLF